MKLPQTYNVNDLPTGSQYELLPAGWYDAIISDAEVKQNNARTGEFIKVKYVITGPTHEGRQVFQNINISNPSALAEEIGRKNLGDICRAIGLATISDTDELLNKSLKIELKIKKSADEKYGDQNDIVKYAELNKQVESKPDSKPNRTTPPWAGKK